MRTLALVSLVVIACGRPGAGDHAPVADASIDPELAPDAGDALGYGEQCGNALDDDGDGRIDEDCAPSLFAGVFAPAVSQDPGLATLEAAAGRTLAVLQTYRATTQIDLDRTRADLAAIFARGQVPHLNIELDYPRAAYAHPAAAPLAGDLAATGEAIARALADAPEGRLLLTFGAEMNGEWTSWGCLSTATFIALYRAAHDAITARLDAHAIDRRRVRWVYGPDARGSARCPSAAAYYPGHAYVDLLGLSAYRSGTASVEAAVLAPLDALFAGTGIPADARRDRFVLLQTGSREVAGRDAWIAELFERLAADPRVAGLIYFDASDWAVTSGGPGWSGLTEALREAPLADRALEGTFAPHFWDVGYGDPGFGEIQALRDHGVTGGCAEAPARFCPARPLRRRDAATLLARAFGLADGGADSQVGCMPEGCRDEPLTESELAAAIVELGGTPPPADDLPATRARGAVLIARGARLVPARL